MNKHYLSITPILSHEELILFKAFNDVCEYNMEIKQPQGYSIWLHDRKGSLKDGFEIIHPKKTPSQLANDYNEAFEKLSIYSNSPFLKENLEIVMNYQSIFLRTNLTHKNSLNYQFDIGTGSTLSHLIKMVNIFHKDGFLRNFLELDIDHHDLSQVITDSQSHEAFIIEETDIYLAYLSSTGYYTRNEKISHKWCKDLLEVIHKKSLQDKLHLLLSNKEKTTVQKI